MVPILNEALSILPKNGADVENDWIKKNIESLNSIYLKYSKKMGPGALIINTNNIGDDLSYPVIFYSIRMFNELEKDRLHIDSYDSEKQMIVVILRQGGKRRIHIVQKHTGGCS